MQTKCIFILCNFVIHDLWKYRPRMTYTVPSGTLNPTQLNSQILIFSVFKIASLSSYWLQVNFFMSLFFYLITFATNLWHQKFVTADVTAVSVNSQHGIQRRGQDLDKNFICNQYGERFAIANTENIKICGWITKLEAIKMQLLAFLPYLLNICRKNWILNFPK